MKFLDFESCFPLKLVFPIPTIIRKGALGTMRLGNEIIFWEMIKYVNPWTFERDQSETYITYIFCFYPILFLDLKQGQESNCKIGKG